MLVHGFNSEGVWPTEDFTDYLVFRDHHQHRSHAEFAEVMLEQLNAAGYTYESGKSCSIVAHSQGGAAALHLYQNHRSCLDNSRAERLIQSVGTGYQGSFAPEMVQEFKDNWYVRALTTGSPGARWRNPGP